MNGTIQPRDRRLASIIWRNGAMSRSTLHRLTGVHANLVGISASRLIESGILREAVPIATGRGRPGAALEIDPDSRSVVGISIAPDVVESVRLNLLGQPREQAIRVPVKSASQMLDACHQAMQRLVDQRTLAIGVSVTGLIDLERRMVLFSSAIPDARDVSLDSIFQKARPISVVLDNDQHATAAAWLLGQKMDPREDALLISIDDGRLGASVLAGGPPNRGCVLAGNELGHMRLPVQTPVCYCGHTGCLERICSTGFLHQLGVRRSFRDVIANPSTDQDALAKMIEHLACGFANAVNFVRPHRMVLIGTITAEKSLKNQLTTQIRARLLPALADRVRIEFLSDPPSDSATAGWLGVAWVFHPTWATASQGAERQDLSTPFSE